jgi:hypothetical protein
MFLEHIRTLELLDHDLGIPKILLFLDSNALLLFPPSVKKKLVNEVTTVLSAGNINQVLHLEPTTTLTSPSHVKWAMEVIGQGFNLPIEEHVIILQSMGVYSTWMLKAESRPVAIQGLGVDSEILQSFFQVSLLD